MLEQELPDFNSRLKTSRDLVGNWIVYMQTNYESILYKQCLYVMGLLLILFNHIPRSHLSPANPKLYQSIDELKIPWPVGPMTTQKHKLKKN